jgi:hypothetical protein
MQTDKTTDGRGMTIIIILLAVVLTCCAFQQGSGLGVLMALVCAAVLAALYLYGLKIEGTEAPVFQPTEDLDDASTEGSHILRIARLLRAKYRERKQVRLLLSGSRPGWLQGHIVEPLEFGRVVVRNSEETRVAVWRDILSVE